MRAIETTIDRTMSLLEETREVPQLPKGDVELRQSIRRYAKEHGDRYSARLFDLWEEWNEKYFGGLMTPAVILLDEPGQTRSYGQCSRFSGLAGIRSQIQLRPSILDGTLRDLREGTKNPEGLRRFLEDVLLHEMIHQYHFEVTGQDDDGYNGHGPAFSAKANEIGEKLGLPRVGRTRLKRDCKEKGLQSPSQWPHDVRPDGYYLGAHVHSSRDTEKPKEVSIPLDLEAAFPMLCKHFDMDEVCRRWREGGA